MTDCEPVVRSPTSQAKTIVLNYVKKFSFAQYEDGSCGFWAEGNAGWFEIKNPNPTYRHVYEQMEEAAAMFYMLSDKWTNGRKTQKHFNDKGIDVYGNSLFDAVRWLLFCEVVDPLLMRFSSLPNPHVVAAT